MKINKVKIQILIKNISGKVSWADVSEPVSLEVAQARVKEYEAQYAHNRYQIVDL